MVTADTRQETMDALEVPLQMTCYELNSDGTYNLSTSTAPSIYIDDRQMSKIWKPDIAEFIRTKYGPVVGVMHRHFLTHDICADIYPTYKYVLGR